MNGKLTDAHRRFIVSQLACFVPAKEVQDALKRDFGVDITLPGVMHYDPHTVNGGEKLAAKWRTLFEQTRDHFSRELAGIPIAQMGWRLRELKRQYDKLEAMGNPLGAAQLLEQAAKETGGMYSNKRILVGANDAPLIPERPDRLTKTEEDEQIRDIVDQAMRRAAIAGSY